MVAEGVPADADPDQRAGRSPATSPSCSDSTDPQDETRLENLVELVSVAREFVAGVAAVAAEGFDATDSRS